ncbi:TPA: bis(5'-nucleosyl)-tetraphosphatase (symmetrical) ApaH [Mannheimia haemolytica]|uniref:bis(5'-nucleosyl)-tetraphosphatase (symmetrical) n=1 Tax=Mannheimia haemolytica TaxID=75985 RepID=A0A547EQ63_MANHA|nr:bis(5'-nucleosyl)-tetraphosphatase (symmetrical) ApaH [Mannheimia haemolytica]AWW71371.1 bis(5'-nucleosyl)-tetraphosphatase (symmetrical) [Pasteurellaceae bacterium 12565]AGI32529.1 bis(5'-nucleosyl)-tetraphosphatase (symmetrical) [Mannheimia haemolytica USDA-ARS-USMARC-183]AGI35438.1 bis(5'-nucleosyl)-tetraphosphatase (symmetrical) [Mannheimia haemolytica USDA-ARS-USMARC-185]AGK02352.1 diadenosine tetraphosphatase ApaH [Mannheimia haemolytica M42548]AGQ24834.1 diadenosine tetraphosphatase 
MATYIVGDLHGCFNEFQLLLEKVNYNPKQDELFLTGDLVARGEDSLACLRFVKDSANNAKTVLGNHDLHLLGIKRVKPNDKIDAIFEAKDRLDLQNWLRNQPLVIHHPKHQFLLTHAGISPEWDLATTLACAKEAEKVLQSDNYADYIAQMYENKPERWSEDLQGVERWRYIINVFTRMRFCYTDKRLDFDCKLPLEQAPQELLAWFDLDNPLFTQKNIIFGHWASLMGKCTRPNIYALDTGCAWGSHLTMLRWEDKQIFTQKRLK